ncbi:MAG: hypothetical protein WKF34_03915 [Pyrinomonadaceae bacterium]
MSARSCSGDAVTGTEAELFQLITKYRSANGLRELTLSPRLSMVANRHLVDLQENVKSFSHSWSDCPYDIAKQSTWTCITDAPVRLNSGFDGQGYEVLYRTEKGTASPSLAIEGWKKSSLHNSIILGREMFKNMAWTELGVAITGNLAAVWFGYPGEKVRAPGGPSASLGVSFDEAIDGLARILSIDKASSIVDANKWLGVSSDKRLRLEIFGRRTNISEASLEVAVKLDASQLNKKSSAAIATFLENLFPEWADRQVWLDNSVGAILENRSASRTKVLQRNSIELRAIDNDSLKLTVRPRKR